MAAKCNKFLPNIFNKSKCQHCFAAKEAHSAEALENNKASRKVSKCGYLFVSPGFDFNNPLDRSKRWQRRFFVLYDDGELTYSVDENPDTVPQCSVDMNKCTDVNDAEKTTTHTNSLSIITPEKTVYIKGNSKEEIQWWHDILAEFPKALKAIRPRRKQPYLILSNKENLQPDSVDGKMKSRSEGPISSTFRGVRSLKHKYDANHQEGLRKSSSLHDLSTDGQDMAPDLESSRFLSRSGDRLDIMSRDNSTTYSLPTTNRNKPNLYFTIPRSTWTRTGQPVPPAFSPKNNNQFHALSSSHFNSSSSISSTSSTNSSAVPRRGSVDDPSSTKSERVSGGSGRYRERSSSLKEFPTQLSLAKSSVDPIPQHSADETDSNETDELKMARSSELSAAAGQASYSLASSSPFKSAAAAPKSSSSSGSQYEDLAYMKKGWLIKHAETEKESRKHWFVLTGNSLRYYKDAKAEERNILDGRIDLSSCYEVSEINTQRNYGFKTKTRNGEYVLAAMTSGIRNNWMKAIRLFMEIHNSASHRGILGSTPSSSSRSATSAPHRALDDFEVKSGNATISTAAVKGAGGETAFQLVGRVESRKKLDTQKPARRHYSDVNPGNVSQVLTLKEFSLGIDSSSQSSVKHPVTKSSYAHKSAGSIDLSSKRSLPSTSFSSSEINGSSSRIPTLKRFVEGSEQLMPASSSSSSPSNNNDFESKSSSSTSSSSKRSVTSESNKEEVKREMMRRAKSPSARVKEKSRASKTSSRAHSPITVMDDSYSWSAVASDAGSVVSDRLDESTYTDMPDVSEDEYPAMEDTDHEDLASAGTSDVVGGEDTLVEILETEVENLKDRLELTQTELDKMQKDNIDLKSRLHKESTQSLDSGYSNSSRWSQASNQPEMLKRQLKEARDTSQRQRLDIESLKGKLDMSVSKLTGTEKALSEALRDYKQEKDKFLKLSTEWNRRIRTLEDNSKENIHKLERSRESLQVKERECRRLEVEVKSHLQRSREQEREILKLRAVEHEYNQLKERLDDSQQELSGLRSELKEKEHVCKRLKDDYEKQLEEMEHEYAHERDCLENHMEQLKVDLYNVHDRQASMTDNMTSNIADILREKDDIIAQLEDKMIEADKKMVEMSEEIHSERGENSELVHDIDAMQEDKMKLMSTIEILETQLVDIQDKVSSFETENHSLCKQLEELQKKNAQLERGLREGRNNSDKSSSSSSDNAEHKALKKTIVDMNSQIEDLKDKLQQAESMVNRATLERNVSNISSLSSSMASDHQDDLLHSIIVIDSHLKEVNSMLLKLRQNFDAYIDSVSSRDPKDEVIKLADLVEDIGHKCQNMQDVLRDPQESILPFHGEEYKHIVTVDDSSDKKVIFSEYKGLKVKFDQVVAELQQVKKGVASIDSSKHELSAAQDSKLKEKIEVMEGAYKQQVVELIARVDALSDRIVNVQVGSTQDQSTSNPFSDNPDNLMKEIDTQLQELQRKLSSLEKQASSSKAPNSSSESGSAQPLSESCSRGVLLKLEDIKSQLEDASTKLDNLTISFPSYSSATAEHISQVRQCEARLSALSSSLEVSSSFPSSQAGQGKGGDSDIAVEGINHCLLDIRERIQEVGELLDSLEEDGEDSDSEDEEGEQTTVEDVREKLASLVEFIEQHSKLSTSDWATLRLLTVQKSSLEQRDGKKPDEVVTAVTADEKLKLYSDKLSLEAVILYEMAHILQNKDFLTPEDSVFREIDCLNSELLFLHQRLDDETKTMHFDNVQADLLSSYSELLAEKVLVNGQLCSSTFDQRSHIHTDSISETQSVQPLLLATEALMRSQIDSHISQNLDRSIEEVISLPTHLMTRAVVQGDLTFALRQLKSRLEQSPEVLQAGSPGYQFVFDRLLERQKRLMLSLNSYEKQMIHSLAVIIWKESEEMTIVDVPESVLEAMCSELSTIMERHIQHHKEKCRSAKDMHSARKYDMIVNELRLDRETVLTKIKSHYEAYSKDQNSIRDSSLDVPVQSLDNSISNFGELLSLKGIVKASTYFLSELLKMGSNVLEDLDLDTDSESGEAMPGVEKGLSSFVSAISDALQAEAISKEALSQKLTTGSAQDSSPSSSSASPPPSEKISDIVLRIPSIMDYPRHLSEKAGLLVREAVFSAQLTFSMFKMKLAHEREMSQLKSRRPLRVKPQSDTEESRDSEETLDLQTDFEALLLPLEEVLESKHEDEVEVLQVVLNQVSQMTTDLKGKNPTSQVVDEHLRQLEQKLHDEINVAKQRHKTHLEVFKQESSQLEKTLEEQQQDHEHYEERCAQLEDELGVMQINHEEEKERMKQDILTAVHAIKSNDEKSESHLTEKASRLGKELAIQKLNFRKMLGAIKKDVNAKDKGTLAKMIDEYMAGISINTEDEEEDYQPPLPDVPPPSLPTGAPVALDELPMDAPETSKALDISHHEQEVEQLKKDKEEALAEEMRNTKAALDAMRKAYEEELVMEKAKYKEALVTMYTEEYVNEIRLRHQEEEEHTREELRKLNLHYSSKCEDYKLLEMRLNQSKQDLESHIQQLISSNNHLEEMLNKEIDSLKDFIKTKPSVGSLTTGSATIEEELYDAKIMVRVKDTELQKLRSQVKNLENSLHRTTEEQRQTMTQYMQLLKTSGENKKQYQCENQQLTERLNKVLSSQGLKANIKRTPSFHQRARSPSPQPPGASPRKDSDHSSRESHRRRHLQPKDLRRSKSSPSLPYVFDGKGVVAKSAASKLIRRSRSPKS